MGGIPDMVARRLALTFGVGPDGVAAGTEPQQQQQQLTPPMREDYKPSWKRRALAGLGGGLAGYGAGRGILEAPYTHQMQDYQMKVQQQQLRQAQDLQKAKISELGQRALAEAARRQTQTSLGKRYERMDTPEYNMQKYGYHPQSLQELEDVEKLKHPAAGTGGIKGIPNTPYLVGPDGKPYKNPGYVPPYHFGLKDREELEKFKAGLKVDKPDKAQTPLAQQQAQKAALQSILRQHPEYNDYVEVYPGGMFKLKDPTWFSREPEKVKAFSDLLDSETQKILQGGQQKFTLEDNEDEDEYQVEEVE